MALSSQELAIGVDGQKSLKFTGICRFNLDNPIAVGVLIDEFRGIAKGLCCGFVLLDQHCAPGEKVVLTDGKRKIVVEIRTDVRPNRTARRPMDKMLGY